MDVDTQKDFLKEFLKGLSRIENAIVVFHYYDEMTIPEIAKSLDLPAETVSQTLSSIISRCKAYLQEQEQL